MSTQLENLNLVALNNNLNNEQAYMLTGLFCKRFAGCNDPDYMRQWAERLKKDYWVYADSTTRKIIIEIRKEYTNQLEKSVDK